MRELQVRTPRARPLTLHPDPALLLSEASLAALNAKLAQPVLFNRFRPNIVVDGANSFAEDTWTTFTIGGSTWRAVKPCSRCKVPNIDQATAEEGVEPMATMLTFRTGHHLGFVSPKENWKNAVFMGVNVLCDAPHGTLLEVGAPVDAAPAAK